MPPASFLEFATEIRLSVYRELFCDLTVRISRPIQRHLTWVSVWHNGVRSNNHLSILSTSRNIHNEARPVFLTNALRDLTSELILPFQFAQMTRILLSYHSALPYMNERHECFNYGPALLDLCRGRSEIQIEVTIPPTLDDPNTSPAWIGGYLLAHFKSYNMYDASMTYLEGDLLLDCIEAMYPDDRDVRLSGSGSGREALVEHTYPNILPTSGSRTTQTGIFVVLRPVHHARHHGLFDDAGKPYTERGFRYNDHNKTLELLDPPDESVSVRVPERAEIVNEMFPRGVRRT